MARLREGDKATIERRVLTNVRIHEQGLTEAELAELTGLERRRLNNYLRALAEKNKIYRDGRTWHAG